MKLEEAVKIFKVFSDPKRLRIFLLLLDSELCVCELMDILKVEQSLLSHQLKILREAGLADIRRRGRWVFYYVPAQRKKQLSPLVEAWLKEELAQARKQGKLVKEKKVCPLGFQEEKAKEKSSLKILISPGLKKKNKK
ncbi:MAG: winged helix-turn-helix transcriptional regulator [Candidatus Aminicenantes bacterium]|jgi:ArsR family transcriptional regulator|nr:winged helix-turn-helix transcriptional regulator [Candidatus Aminicenantes bacterium]